MLFGRRVRFAIVVLASQLLLVALAAVALVQMILIATNGRVSLAEDNLAILWPEIIVALLVTVFGITVFGIQLRRLGERRRGDGVRDQRRNRRTYQER
jgi:hypothetical protein